MPMQISHWPEKWAVEPRILGQLIWRLRGCRWISSLWHRVGASLLEVGRGLLALDCLDRWLKREAAMKNLARRVAPPHEKRTSLQALGFREVSRDAREHSRNFLIGGIWDC